MGRKRATPNEDQTDMFGTDPGKLARTHDPFTSHVAAHAVDTATWERRVYAAIERLGKRGAIQDEVIVIVRREYGNVPYSTITARFKALREKGLISYLTTQEGKPVTRNGNSGRPSRVRVATKHLPEEVTP